MLDRYPAIPFGGIGVLLAALLLAGCAAAPVALTHPEAPPIRVDTAHILQP